MAIYRSRRVLKEDQETLLRRHLPESVEFLGAFQKSGNFALVSAVLVQRELESQSCPE